MIHTPLIFHWIDIHLILGHILGLAILWSVHHITIGSLISSLQWVYKKRSSCYLWHCLKGHLVILRFPSLIISC